MSIRIVQSVKSPLTNINVGTPYTLTFPSALRATHTVVVIVLRTNPGTSSTFALTDTADSTALTIDVNSQDSSILDTQVVIASRWNIPGGNTTITIAISPGLADSGIRVSGFELSGVSPTKSVITGSNPNESATTTHLDSTTALTGTGFILSGASLGNVRVHTAGAGFTLDHPGAGVSDALFSQYAIGTLADSKGPHTHDSTGVRSAGAMAIYQSDGTIMTERPTRPAAFCPGLAR